MLIPPASCSVDVAILGAGPAGLAAAWQAARNGLSVVVLERAGAVGGMAASFDVAGIRVDHGSHRLHPGTGPHVLAALRELVDEDLQLRPRNARLHIFDRWVAFPPRAAELARTLPPGVLARLAADTVTGPLRRPGSDDDGTGTNQGGPPDGRPCRATEGDRCSAALMLRAGLGPTLYHEFGAPYATKLWGRPPEHLDAEQTCRRVAGANLWRIAARSLRGDRARHRTFYYPRRGFGQLVDALVQAGVEAGVAIRTSTEVTGIRLDGPDPLVSIADGSLVEAGHVLSTIPLPMLARLSVPSPPATVLAAAGALPFRAMVLVYLVHRGGRWTDFDTHYLPGPDTPVNRISEPTNHRVSQDDPTNRTVLCAELPCDTTDAVWDAADTELVDLVVDGLARHGLPTPQVGEVAVRRLAQVYPVFELGYQQHLTELDTWADGLRRVTTLGRLGTFAHSDTHHALAMGLAAADALAPARRPPR